MTELDEKCINTIRFLAADAIEKAKSGHPGMPMGAAATAYTLWTKHLKHNPAHPGWIDRDRFVLSAGHASMLLYALLYLTGYDISLEDLQSFRQWGSKTPGHPERNHPPGTEVTTGPLGQGISNAVGMAIAEAHLAARYNRPGYPIVNHYTYVMASDGDLMEGVTYESCSLAGHLGLGKLIVFYDDNRVSLAGATALSFTEEVGDRFAACGWQALRVEHGNDIDEIDQAIRQAQAETNRPSLIAVQTSIGYGAPDKQDSCEAHGAPLGATELAGAKSCLGWPAEPTFFVPEAVVAFFQEARKIRHAQEDTWKKLFQGYIRKFPEPAAEFNRIMQRELPAGWDTNMPQFPAGSKDIATRKASEAVMQALAVSLPELMGGSADLNPSTFTWLKGKGDFQPSSLSGEAIQGKVGGIWGYEGRNLHFGVREHAMGSVAVGLALHGGIIPYTATFLTFADYMRPPMRLSALMGLPVIFVFTHDSIGLGEDGPTHQPVEHLLSLRAIPNLTVIRPADAAETVEAWKVALQNQQGPTALIFSRQNLPILTGQRVESAADLRKGAYVLWEAGPETPEVILIGTGSEVMIALEASRQLAASGIKARVVSMPSWELFDRQPADYRNKILPPAVKVRVAVEAAGKLGWEHYVGLDGAVVGMTGFGASAPATMLYEKFGITAEQVSQTAQKLLVSWNLLSGDPVTGLGNRRYFDTQVTARLDRSDGVTKGILLLIKLNDLDKLNQLKGFQAGDELLKRVAKLLQDSMRQCAGSILARLTGGDFGIFLPDVRAWDTEVIAGGVANQLSGLAAEQLSITDNIGYVGAATYETTTSLGRLLSEADLALTAARQAGPNGWSVRAITEETATMPLGQQQWREKLEKALQERRISLDAQPVVTTADRNQIIHLEIFSRIVQEDGKFLSAGIFMPLAERLNLVSSIDRIVLEEVIKLDRRQLKVDSVAVNISPASLQDNEFRQWVFSFLKNPLPDAPRIIFEFSEFGAIRNFSLVKEFSTVVRECGHSMGLDHYGQSFSHLGYLQSLHPDYVKIDRAYTGELKDEESDSRFFFGSLCSVAHSIDIAVIAEGVETEQQAKILKELNLDAIQGYYIDRPKPIDSLVETT